MILQLEQPAAGSLRAHAARPEHELLLACARSRMDEAHAARIAALAARAGLDWEYLLAFARRHSLLPLLYRQLAARAPAGQPPSFYRQQLRESYRRNAARNLFLTGELGRILRACAAAQVEAIPYKGPALAARAYGDLALRRFADLDLMTRKRDVARAKEALAALGYALWPPLTEAQQSVLLRTQHNLAFAREEGRLLVELHWEVAAKGFSAELASEAAWTRLETIELGGWETRSFAPEDLLLSLCVHGAKHFWERLAWVCDLNELVAAHRAMDWPAVFARASATGNERMLCLGLRLAAELLGTELPAEMKRRVFADPVVAGLAERAAAGIFREPASPLGMLAGMRFNLRARRRLSDKARYLGFILQPTDGDLRALTLPAPLSFLYYLLRPVRLLTKRAPLP